MARSPSRPVCATSVANPATGLVIVPPTVVVLTDTVVPVVPSVAVLRLVVPLVVAMVVAMVVVVVEAVGTMTMTAECGGRGS